MTDRLAEIFKRQGEFVDSLRPILLRNEMHPGYYPLNLDGRFNQEHFRLLAWRIQEELIEATEVYYECIDVEGYEAKFLEEMSDVLHFLIELCLATGVSEGELLSGFEGTVLNPNVDQLAYSFFQVGKSEEDTIPQRVAFVSYKLGLAMHCLKQRPWRTDHRPTNRSLFVGRMHATWFTFVSACKRSKISSDDLYGAYFAKGKVNDQRTASQEL